MLINANYSQAVPIVELSGRFDAYEVPEVDNKLMELANSHQAKIIVDMHAVDFIDSSALATLVKALKHCRQNQGDLYLCDLNNPVRIIFELTRLDKAFHIYPTIEDAVQAFSLQLDITF